MTQLLSKMLERVKTWPAWRQDDAARMLKVLEQQGTEIYHLSDEERRSINEALASGIVPDEEMEKFWKRHGV